MIPVELSVLVRAPRTDVWAELAQLERHVLWMADAESIDFRSSATTGVGTQMDCLTKLGPFTTNDVMTVTEWIDGYRMAVEHKGVVTGVGSFELHDDPEGTRLVWVERLSLPWFPFGGPIGEQFAAPLMKLVWKGNLTRFRDLVEAA